MKVPALWVLWAVVLTSLWAGPAAAAPPQKLDYQGYLSDSNGVPLTRTVSLRVALYDAAVGGLRRWSQMSTVTPTNGRFTLVLSGTRTNPFPPGLFDRQLYVGLTVGSDPEMKPRQALTSVPSAFEAMNADTLDGLEAAELIDVASDEVRTPIDALPFTIDAPGSYYLTGNLDGSAGGIDVTVDNVTIDLMGFTIDGGGTIDDDGINLQGRNEVVIRNGIIRAFGRAGIINLDGDTGGNVVEDVQAVGNGPNNPGIQISSSSRIERCIARDNGRAGIISSENSLVRDNIAENNGGFGIYASGGSTLVNNTALENEDYGIYGGTGATLIGNTASYNRGWGIYGSGSNTFIGNTAFNNNLDLADDLGGIRVGSDSLVKSNTVDSNRHSGIVVNGTDNVLRENHATDSTPVGGDSFCFQFTNTSSSDNAVIGNTATNCGVEFEFEGSAPPASRYIGNIAW